MFLTMAQNEPSRRFASGAEIPDKLYFRIGDVAKLCEVPAYVLRFWETEFPQLKPNKGGTGQRLYRRRDVELALRIKRLLYDEGYTIPGARQVFKSEMRTTREEPQLALAIEPDTGARQAAELKQTRALQRVRKELDDLRAMLERPAGTSSARPVQAIRAARGTRGLQPMRAAETAMEDLFAGPSAIKDEAQD